MVVMLSSCRTIGFYSQAAQGQWQILRAARPLPEVIADGKSSAPLKQKLLLIEELRAYAKTTLHLPVDKQFKDYADLKRRYVVWVVFAAPAYSVEAEGWWYPLVGTLHYRGFFTEAAATAEAEKLMAKGLDVHVGGTEAYSTLGWFADPVLNTFLNRDTADLAELIFHELTHARIFIAGDTEFNEALATAVGGFGVREWLRSKGDKKALQDYEASMVKDREIIKLLLSTRAELKTAYATATDKAAAKAACFAEMRQRYEGIKQRWTGASPYDRFFAKPMNNARLCTVSTYYDMVPDFERLIALYPGDIDGFFARVAELGELDHDARRLALREVKR
jgi:predicted aminopeptidase